MALPREAARRFRDIEFGFADAHKEGAEASDLLIRAFFDDTNLVTQALSGSSILFLGYRARARRRSQSAPACWRRATRSCS
jgi:hypothetical protein